MSYTSIIDNQASYISQLIVPNATGLTGGSASLPATAKGSIAYDFADAPNNLFLANGTNWLSIGNVGPTGATGPAVSLQAASTPLFFNNNSGITGDPPGCLLDISYLTGSSQKMIGMDLLFNTTFQGGSPPSGIATLSTSVPIASQYIPANNKTFAGTLIDSVGNPNLVQLVLDNTGLFHIIISVAAQTYNIESISGIYKSP